MQIYQPGAPFSFSYGAYDQSDALNIAASIYDMTSGSPEFVAFVVMPLVTSGVYSGSFQGAPNKSYLVIMASYTSTSYSTVDDSRPPSAECYQDAQRSSSTFSFNYATYDLDEDLFVAASLYSGNSFIAKIDMQEVALGVYWGSYNTVVQGDSYYLISQVYTDDTYSTVDPSRTPSNDTYQGFVFQDLLAFLQFPNLIGSISDNPQYPFGQDQITLITGESRSFGFRIIDSSFAPFDCTGLTDIQVHLTQYNGTALILSLSPSYGGISAVNIPQGRFVCNLTVDQTNQLKTGEQSNFTVYLYFGNFATGTYDDTSFAAASPGSDGNVTIVFDGVSDINTILQEFAQANPETPEILLVSGATGTSVLAAGTLTLSGGTDNTRIVNFYRALNIRGPSI